MDQPLITSTGSFAIHINGDSSIDALALSQLIGDMAMLTKEAALYEEPTADCKVNVTAFKNGSFEIDFAAVVGTVSSLVTETSTIINIAKTAISTVKGYFELKKLLNGSQPKEVQELSGGKIYVTAEDGGSALVNKGSGEVYMNCNIDNHVQNITYNIGSIINSEGFSFDTDGSSESFDRNDLVRMSKQLPIVNESICKKSTIKTDLLIKKPDLLGHSTWTFRWRGRNIEAKIDDDDFLDIIRAGSYSIHGGSYIVADMEISIDLDQEGIPDEKTTKYTIKKVYGGIKDTVAEMQSII